MRNIVKQTILCAMLVVSALTSPATVAIATAEEKGTAEQRAACTPDVFRLCASEIPSVDRIVMCLKREKPRLSAGCKAVFASR
jgi:hypothetical protein